MRREVPLPGVEAPSSGSRCRRLANDYQRYARIFAGLYVVAFVSFMLKQTASSPYGFTTPSTYHALSGRFTVLLHRNKKFSCIAIFFLHRNIKRNLLRIVGLTKS